MHTSLATLLHAIDESNGHRSSLFTLMQSLHYRQEEACLSYGRELWDLRPVQSPSSSPTAVLSDLFESLSFNSPKHVPLNIL